MTSKQPTTRNRKTQSAAAVDDGRGTQSWTFLTNHAHVLAVLHSDSEKVLREVALEVGITERAVQKIIQNLEEAGSSSGNASDAITAIASSRSNHFAIRSNPTGRLAICSS